MRYDNSRQGITNRAIRLSRTSVPLAVADAYGWINVALDFRRQGTAIAPESIDPKKVADGNNAQTQGKILQYPRPHSRMATVPLLKWTQTKHTA